MKTRLKSFAFVNLPIVLGCLLGVLMAYRGIMRGSSVRLANCVQCAGAIACIPSLAYVAFGIRRKGVKLISALYLLVQSVLLCSVGTGSVDYMFALITYALVGFVAYVFLNLYFYFVSWEVRRYGKNDREELQGSKG